MTDRVTPMPTDPETLDVERLRLSGAALDTLAHEFPESGAAHFACDWDEYEEFARAYAATPPSPAPEGEHVERMADIEHEQWMTWARSVMSADDVTIGPERLARWQSYMVPYADLPEHVKEHDRVWARAALAATPAPEVEPHG